MLVKLKDQFVRRTIVVSSSVKLVQAERKKRSYRRLKNSSD
jgi:hypothetical protein